MTTPDPDATDWDAEIAADRERFRSGLADSGPRGIPALRGFDAAMRDHDSGVMGARNCWHSLSAAQRRVCLFLAPGRVLLRSLRRRNYYDAHGGPHAISMAARLDTVRHLARRELVAWDGTARDPEARAVATERMAFVVKHGQMGADDGR